MVAKCLPKEVVFFIFLFSFSNWTVNTVWQENQTVPILFFLIYHQRQSKPIIKDLKIVNGALRIIIEKQEHPICLCVYTLGSTIDKLHLAPCRPPSFLNTSGVDWLGWQDLSVVIYSLPTYYNIHPLPFSTLKTTLSYTFLSSITLREKERKKRQEECATTFCPASTRLCGEAKMNVLDRASHSFFLCLSDFDFIWTGPGLTCAASCQFFPLLFFSPQSPAQHQTVSFPAHEPKQPQTFVTSPCTYENITRQ